MPVKSLSLWIKDIHLTLQYAEVNEMWISVSFDAIATLRLLARYTLTGLFVERETRRESTRPLKEPRLSHVARRTSVH